MDYTITLTDTEKKSMDYITTDIDDWITNAAQYYHVSGGGVLSLSKDDYVTFFGSEGWHVGVETNVSGFLIG